MNKGEKWGKSFKICDVTQLGPNLKNVTSCFVKKNMNSPEDKEHGFSDFSEIFGSKMLRAVLKCDTIKRNESHVGNIQFWFFDIKHLLI